MLDALNDIVLKGVLGYSVLPTFFIYSITCVFLLLPNSKRLKKAITALVLFVIEFVVLVCLYAFVDLPFYNSIITYFGFPPLLTLFLFVLYTIWFEKRDANKQITIASIYHLVFCSISAFSGALGACQDHQWHLNTNFDFTSFSNIVLLLSLSLLFLRFNISKIEYFPKYSKYMSLCFSGFCITIFHFVRNIIFPKFKETNTLSSLLFLYVLLIIIALIFYIMFYQIGKEYKEKVDAKLLYENEKNNEQISRLTNDNYEALRKIRHDIKNQYAMMGLLIKDEKYDELKKYYAEYTEKWKNILDYTNCGNKMIDNLINLEKLKASEKGIQIDTKIAIPPLLPFSSTDLCSLITNILDNAIEEIERIQDLKNKNTVSVQIGIHESYFILGVSNPTADSKNKDLISKKQDKNNHGYGLKIIKSIVKKYKGSMQIENENNEFNISVILLMELEKKQ